MQELYLHNLARDANSVPLQSSFSEANIGKEGMVQYFQYLCVYKIVPEEE